MIIFGAVTKMCHCALPLRTPEYLLTEPRAKSDVFTKNLPFDANAGLDLLCYVSYISHLTI